MTVAVVGNNIISIHMSSNRIAYGPKVIDVNLVHIATSLRANGSIPVGSWWVHVIQSNPLAYHY
jgi:hypothetical protein